MIQIIIMKKESMYKYLHLLHAPFENVGDRVIVHPTSSLPPLASVYHKALGAATSVFPCQRTVQTLLCSTNCFNGFVA